MVKGCPSTTMFCALRMLGLLQIQRQVHQNWSMEKRTTASFAPCILERIVALFFAYNPETTYKSLQRGVLHLLESEGCCSRAVILFSKLNLNVLGYVRPIHVKVTRKNEYFRGCLTDTSDKTVILLKRCKWETLEEGITAAVMSHESSKWNEKRMRCEATILNYQMYWWVHPKARPRRCSERVLPHRYAVLIF